MTDHRRRTTEDKLLGMDTDISRRDFLNSTLIGAGAALLTARAPSAWSDERPSYAGAVVGDDWYGYGGVGDYASSHGNTPGVVNAAHGIRDGRYESTVLAATDTGETYDLVVVGGGFAGLAAAYTFNKQAGAAGKRCLILENHPIFGGEAKRNEFDVDGHRLIGPQGSNGFTLPYPVQAGGGAFSSGDDVWYMELGCPKELQYQHWDTQKFRPLQFSVDNYTFYYWKEKQVSVGYFSPGAAASDSPHFSLNPMRNDFKDVPIPQAQKDQLRSWLNDTTRPHTGEDWKTWLDSMSYKDYIEKVMRLSPEVTRFSDPFVAAGIGLGCDAISAYGTYALALPGVLNYYDPALTKNRESFVITRRDMFPGGNDTFIRYFVKRMIPAAISGTDAFHDIALAPVNLAALDRAAQPVRIRLQSTVVRVVHAGSSPEHSDAVNVTYRLGDKLYRVRAKAVVMASGAWVNRHIVRDLPVAHREAYATFMHSPVLTINIALSNWRFLYERGITAARWFNGVGEDFGFSCNIRVPMVIGEYQPPLDPDKPTVLNMHIPFYYPGTDPRAQGIQGRMELFATSYSSYERKIKRQLQAVFGPSGFDSRRDIRGIILNRWGHAYVNPVPGFYFGRNGAPAPRDVIRQSYGRIAFAHSELHGNQHWGPAAVEGERAARQVMSLIT